MSDVNRKQTQYFGEKKTIDGFGCKKYKLKNKWFGFPMKKDFFNEFIKYLFFWIPIDIIFIILCVAHQLIPLRSLL